MQVAMRPLVEEEQIELAQWVGMLVVVLGHRVPGLLLSNCRRRRTSPDSMSDSGTFNRRRHVVSSTWPGTLCGARSPMRSSRSAMTRYASLAARRSKTASSNGPSPSLIGCPTASSTNRRYRSRTSAAWPATAVANAGMSWVRTPATERAGIAARWSSPMVNCSWIIPSASQRCSASVTSSGTVPRSSPMIVVDVAAASAATTASNSSRG